MSSTIIQKDSSPPSQCKSSDQTSQSSSPPITPPKVPAVCKSPASSLTETAKSYASEFSSFITASADAQPKHSATTKTVPSTQKSPQQDLSKAQQLHSDLVGKQVEELNQPSNKQQSLSTKSATETSKSKSPIPLSFSPSVPSIAPRKAAPQPDSSSGQPAFSPPPVPRRFVCTHCGFSTNIKVC